MVEREPTGVSGRQIQFCRAPASESLLTGEDRYANRTPAQAAASQCHSAVDCLDMYTTQVGWVQSGGRGGSATAHPLPCSP